MSNMGSIGMRRDMAIGREMRRARTELETIAVGSQKLEPRERERRKRRIKVMCMQM